MASNASRVHTLTLGTTLLLLIATELAAGWCIQRTVWPPLLVLGCTRLLQSALMIVTVIRLEGGLAAIGCSPASWPAGLKKGLFWSAGFALAAAAGMGLCYAVGQNPLTLLHTPLPARTYELVLFFAVGGVIAPLAEEICFRGVLYSFFRKWGIWVALLASTAIFVALHSVRGVPVTQIVGGLIFAIAYEISGNLMVPITIHMLGNMAIFALSLPMVHRLG